MASAGVVVCLATAASSFGFATAEATEQVDCPTPQSDGAFSAEQVQGAVVDVCNLQGEVVSVDGFSLLIPNPGESVALLALGDADAGDEEGASVEVSVDAEGVVALDDDPDFLARPTADGPCEQTSYSLNGYKWTSEDLPSKWFINRGTIPAALDADNVVGALRDAMQNITYQNNTCNMDDQFSKAASFQGDTNSGTGLCADSPTTNSKNTLGWGPIDGTTIAVACVYSSGGDVIEADLRMDNSNRTWTLTGGSSACSGKQDVVNVATHEFGHWWGLGHSGGSDLTMFGSAGACETKKRTLGAGDVFGSRQLG